MSNDPKKIDFNTKEDLIIYSSLLIELTIKHMHRYKHYYNELISLTCEKVNSVLEKEKITSDNLMKYLSKMEFINEARKKVKIKYFDYKSIEDKISNVQGQLLNLLGDRTSKGGISYWRFRSEYDKMVKCKNLNLPVLETLTENMRKSMNELYSARNYTHHMTDAKFIEWKKYREKELEDVGAKLFDFWPNENINITYCDYLDINWLFQFTINQIEFKKVAESVLQQMKKDYSRLYGKSIHINQETKLLLDFKHSEISDNGYNRHCGKMK